MKARRTFSLGLTGLAVGSLFAIATPTAAFACHSGQLEDDVCIAVDDCHILTVHDLDNGIAGIRYNPPQTGVLQCVDPR